MPKLTLGTAQFGLHYGISNQRGKVGKKSVKAILNYAQQIGIDTLDTAHTYGNSEYVLGPLASSSTKIITKTLPMGDSQDTTCLDHLNHAFMRSIQLLHRNPYGLMVHHERDLLGPLGDKIDEQMRHFKAQGLVQKIGVSVYTPEALSQILNRYSMDMVQLPINLLDQRFVDMLPMLKQRGVEIYARSIFLQGLLLMPLKNVDTFFDPIYDHLCAIPEPRLDLCLSFVKMLDLVDFIVVGITTLEELQMIYLKFTQYPIMMDYTAYRLDEEKFINPSRWELSSK